MIAPGAASVANGNPVSAVNTPVVALNENPEMLSVLEFVTYRKFPSTATAAGMPAVATEFAAVGAPVVPFTRYEVTELFAWAMNSIRGLAFAAHALAANAPAENGDPVLMVSAPVVVSWRKPEIWAPPAASTMEPVGSCPLPGPLPLLPQPANASRKRTDARQRHFQEGRRITPLLIGTDASPVYCAET